MLSRSRLIAASTRKYLASASASTVSATISSVVTLSNGVCGAMVGPYHMGRQRQTVYWLLRLLLPVCSHCPHFFVLAQVRHHRATFHPVNGLYLDSLEAGAPA